MVASVEVPVTVKPPPVVRSPVPVVMALLVVVFNDSVPVPVISSTDELPARTSDDELNVEAPVPVEKLFEPVMVVAPLSEIAPVPLENVPDPD